RKSCSIFATIAAIWCKAKFTKLCNFLASKTSCRKQKIYEKPRVYARLQRPCSFCSNTAADKKSRAGNPTRQEVKNKVDNQLKSYTKL
ncbi:MAG: hypothetical protein QXZ70_07175, partial [Candidatus Bathyarchaeia archaeon]